MMSSRILLLTGFLVATASVAAAQQAPTAAPAPQQAPAAAAPAAAAPATIGTFKAWSAYMSSEAGDKTCFAAAQPQDSKYSRTISTRGDAFFMITTIPSKNIRNEASTIIGYPFKAGSAVTANVDGTDFKMFFNDATGETSWAMQDQEAALVAAMKKGTKLSVKSTSSRGTEVTDNYSLSGISAALDAVAKECP
jgi:invasion protein IalB